ncbi:hypothetical protein AB6804_30395 [Caballeronia sp. RCC_10]
MKKKTFLLAACSVSVLFSGCVSTTYTKSVSLRKDADGKIIERIETESVTQPNQSGWPIKLEHLKGVQS